MKKLINGKFYRVSYVFNMVGNYYFTRKGFDFLVDAEDVSVWLEDNDLKFDNRLEAAVAFARDMATEDGCFWWKVKELV